MKLPAETADLVPREGLDMQEIILASRSPRRQEILTLAGIPFTVCPAADETPLQGLAPAEYALALARQKSEQIFRRFPDRIVLGADTIVVRDGDILGKPRDEKDAVEMLLSLAGREHQVMTGVWVCSPEKCDGFTDIATVRFFPFTPEEAAEYVASGESMDKAGGYGIQGLGMRFVEGIDGDFYTVMGLPGGKLRRFLLPFFDF